MTSEIKDTALATTEQQSNELAISAQQAMARHEIEGSIVIAQRFPRNEDEAFGRVMKSCSRFSMAAMATYSYPRGGAKIEGPSVNLAREIARCWGNIRYGADIVQDDEDSRTVRGWAWDVQTNTKETQDATFKKLVYRKKGGWIKPDERDLRELTNKHGAICVRNALLHLVPPDLVDEALQAAKRTLEQGVSEDVEGHRHKMIKAFGTLGVSVADLELYLGHELRHATTPEIADLRTVYKSIADGNSAWSEYVKDKTSDKSAASEGGATVDDLLGKSKAAKTPPESTPKPAPKPTDPPGLPEFGEHKEVCDNYVMDIGICDTLAGLNAVAENIQGNGDLSPEIQTWFVEQVRKQAAKIKKEAG
jgi:hypothetical protein